MAETIATFPAQIAGIDQQRQAVVIILLAHREDQDGTILPLAVSQKEAARNAAQAALEITPGTEVLGTSTALLLPHVELAEGESLSLSIDAAVVKTAAEAPAEETETKEEPAAE